MPNGTKRKIWQTYPMPEAESRQGISPQCGHVALTAQTLVFYLTCFSWDCPRMKGKSSPGGSQCTALSRLLSVSHLIAHHALTADCAGQYVFYALVTAIACMAILHMQRTALHTLIQRHSFSSPSSSLANAGTI